MSEICMSLFGWTQCCRHKGRPDDVNVTGGVDLESNGTSDARETFLHQNNVQTRQEAVRGSQDTQQSERRRRAWSMSGVFCKLGSSMWLKLTLFVGVLVLVSCGTLAFVLWENCNGEIKNSIELRLRTVATLRAQQLLDYIEGERDKARVISSRVLIEDLLASKSANGTLTDSQVAVGRNDLFAAIESLSEFHDAWALDLQGSLVFAANGTDLLPPKQAIAGAGQYGDEVRLSAPYIHGRLGRIINITSPVTQNARRVGTLLSFINATKFDQLVTSGIGFSSEGELIAGYEERPGGDILYLVPPRLSNNMMSRPSGGPLQRAINNETGFTEFTDYRNTRVVAAYSPVGYLNWGLAANEPTSEAYRPVNKLKTIIIITIVSVLLFGLAISWLLARVFTRPIVELNRIAIALAEGNMEARATRGYRLWEDEIDGLRRTFNTMADQLTTAYATLEAKVQDRTQELALANKGLEHEVMHRKKAEVELEAARNVAVAADKMKSEWLANMSHEIRTPLNGVINCTELCMDTNTTPEQHEYLELSLFSAKHLLRLITDILDFSKIEAGKLNMESIEFTLLDQMEHSISVLAARAHKKGLDLVCSTSPDLPEVLIGDPGRLFQIFVNLIGNAIKFTERGEVVLRASANSHPDAGKLELLFSVTDTGIGIPKEKQSLLFQAFSQVTASTTRIYGGTGLGLVISSKLSSAMGGRMWVDSDEGHGCTFYFTAVFLLPPFQAPPIGLLTPANLAPLWNIRSLVVATSPSTRATAADLLERWGLKVEEAGSGGEALERMEKASDRGQPFQLMLLDLELPAEGARNPGCKEILRLLRQQPQLLKRTRSNPTAVSSSKQAMQESSGTKLGDKLGMPEVDIELELPKEFQDMRNIGKVYQADSKDGSGLGGGSSLRAAGVPSSGSQSPRGYPPSPRKDRSPRRGASSTGSEDICKRAVAAGLGLGSGKEDGGTSTGPGSGQLEPGWALPIVILGSSANSAVARAEELGVEAVVQRPIKRSLLLRAVRMALQLGEPSNAEVPTSPLPGSNGPVRKLHILVAEDNVINQRVALTLLHKWGHTTVLASTGAEAVEKYTQERFDLVLMDVQMPVMDGLEATQKIRQHEAGVGRKTPIVAMTAHAMMGDGEKCIAAGMDAYVPKPLNSAKLQDLLGLVAEEKELPSPSSISSFSASLD